MELQKGFATGQGKDGYVGSPEAYVQSEYNRLVAGRATTPPAPAQPVTDEALHALGVLEGAHNLLDLIEDRLFGPQPREASYGNTCAAERRLSVSEAVSRSFLEATRAQSRLEAILGRL